MLIVDKFRETLPSYSFKKLGNWIIKWHPINQLSLRHVSFNFSNVWLQTILITSLSRNTCSVVIKQVFKNDVAVKTEF